MTDSTTPQAQTTGQQLQQQQDHHMQPPSTGPNSGPTTNGTTTTANGNGAPTPASSVTKSSAKDPSRPRRKKARRACFACQRAHLTCGDERPCQRCIKRGLGDQCHDGVRKKAKYLHDAPIDDGPPEFAPQPTNSATGSYPYHQQLAQQQQQTQQRTPTTSGVAGDMLPPDGTINPNSIESPGAGMGDPQGGHSAQQAAYSTTPLFDPSDPALFNFDIASLNFGSHYGALEFGVLNQMSGGTNAHGTATPDNNGRSGANSNSYATYSPGVTGDNYAGFTAPQDINESWQSTTRDPSNRPGFANTYMIEAGPGSLTSPSPPVESPRQSYQPPSSTTAQQSYNPESPAPISSPSFFSSNLQNNRPAQPSTLQQVQSAPANTNSQLLPPPHLRRRRIDDPSHIYSSVTAPYPYAIQHHRLFHMLESRFPKPLLLRIARAMASFRPSFIACTQTLKADDLLFMEKCFQRTLWEYGRFIQSCGTPTIVCRRTGEVVEVGKEFCMLTGWERAILLGEKPNRNTNRAWGTTVKQEGGTSNHPLLPPPDEPEGANVKRPVFLAELLDDESVVEFYEQFARLAFGDSRGAVMTTCKVLTYNPPPEEEGGGGTSGGGGGGQGNKASLAGKEGKVECAFCWTIKRDVFDIPMLIVGNVSAPFERSERLRVCEERNFKMSADT